MKVILIYDDDNKILENVGKHFKNFSFIKTCSIKRFLKFKKNADLIIIDVIINNKSNLKLIEKLKKEKRKILIVNEQLPKESLIPYLDENTKFTLSSKYEKIKEIIESLLNI